MAKKNEGSVISIAKQNYKVIQVTLVGLTPLLMQRFSERKMQDLIENQGEGGKQKRSRPPRDPQAEFEESIHRLADGKPGIPATAIKGAMIQAAHKDFGIPQTDVKKSIIVLSDDGDLIRLKSKTGPRLITHMRRISGTMSPVHRAVFPDWECTFKIRFNADRFSAESVVNLLDKAAHEIGFLEFRPFSKSTGNGGTFGTAEIKRS